MNVEAFSSLVHNLEHRQRWEEDLVLAWVVGQPFQRHSLMATCDLVLDLGDLEREVEGRIVTESVDDRGVVACGGEAVLQETDHAFVIRFEELSWQDTVDGSPGLGQVLLAVMVVAIISKGHIAVLGVFDPAELLKGICQVPDCLCESPLVFQELLFCLLSFQGSQELVDRLVTWTSVESQGDDLVICEFGNLGRLLRSINGNLLLDLIEELAGVPPSSLSIFPSDASVVLPLHAVLLDL